MPSKFQFVRFAPSPGARTSDSLDLKSMYKGSVLRYAPASKDTIFLPKLELGSFLEDNRLSRPGGGKVVYTPSNGKWLSRSDEQFQVFSNIFKSSTINKSNKPYSSFRRTLVLSLLLATLLVPIYFLKNAFSHNTLIPHNNKTNNKTLMQK
jgi:hypothetical protein